MNDTGITQLKEVLVLVGSLVRDSLEANKDGKVTAWEMVKIGTGNAAKIIDAVSGISEVPAELADLSVEEMDELYSAIMPQLGWHDHMHKKNLFDTIYNFTRNTAYTVQTMRNLLWPPKAVVVEERYSLPDPP